MLKRFRIREPGHINRYAPDCAPGHDAWDGDSLRSLDFQSKTLLCELLDRLGTSDFPCGWHSKNDGSPDGRPLTVMSCIWRICRVVVLPDTGTWMDRSMPPSIFGARPCAAASDGAWEVLMDVDESRVGDQDLTLLTLDQKQCFDRLQLASLRELGSRLGMRRWRRVLNWRYLFIDGQPTSMLIRDGDLRSPTYCSLLSSGGLGLECVHEEGTPTHVRTTAHLDDRLVSADSCDPLPRILEITKQVDDYFGAVLNSKNSSSTSTKVPSRHRRKLCELIDCTRSLVYLGVDVLVRGAPWREPRVRMKQRVRAVGV